MNRRVTDKPQQQTTFAPRIVGILLKNFAVIDDRGFNLIEVQIIFQPFLLGMKANLIVPSAHERLNLAQLHGRFYVNQFKTAIRVLEPCHQQ